MRLSARLLLLLAPILLTQCGGLTSSPAGSSTGRRGIGRVLLIGDSLSVGSFGETMESYLLRKAGPGQTYIYASCGSSVQSWLSSEKPFVTTCGYRETRPGVHILLKHRNGRRPPPATTPKVETLLRKIRPDTVLVQLGTNHFDVFQRYGASKLEEQRAYFDAFAKALTSSGHRPAGIIWIMPPDSSKFSLAVETAVEKLIFEACRRHGIGTMRSKAVTKYVPGVTGGDGVHYADEPGKAWADRVTREMDKWF